MSHSAQRAILGPFMQNVLGGMDGDGVAEQWVDGLRVKGKYTFLRTEAIRTGGR